MGKKFNTLFATFVSAIIIMIPISTQAAGTTLPMGVTYDAHVQSIGWQKPILNPLSWFSNGAEAGTNGQSLRMEALRIKLDGTLPVGAGIQYDAHVQSIGWQKPVVDGAEAGTNGRSLRMEALTILLNAPGYSVKYRAHVQSIGWQPWVYNGAIAGTTGKGLRMEALEVSITHTPDVKGETFAKATSDLTAAGFKVIQGPDTKGTTTSIPGTVATQIDVNNAFEVISAYANYIVPIPVTGITLNKTTDSLINGYSDTLIATLTPTNTTDTQITWKSSNPAIVTVDNTGKIWASGGYMTAAGTATITATTADGSNVATCVVSVIVYPYSITLNKTTDSLAIGNTDILTPVILPADSTDKTVKWTSSDDTIATVDSTGKVTAVRLGTAIITATTAYYNTAAKCTVTIK